MEVDISKQLEKKGGVFSNNTPIPDESENKLSKLLEEFLKKDSESLEIPY